MSEAAQREAKSLSKIIKRGKFSEPATLGVYQPPFLKNDFPEKNTRSLKFISNVRDEIGEWYKRFSIYRTTKKKQVDLEVEKAYQNGYDRGFTDGLNREKADRIKAIDILLLEAKRKKDSAVSDMEVKVVELAISIAERIIGNRIDADPEIVTDIICEVMSNIISGESIILKVSEEDLALVNSRYEQWLGMAGNAKEFRIESDRRLHRGDCVVETEGGIIDGVVANRLDSLVETLLKR